tara:strand:+ start:2062 stop:2280 length:219 start_codon:yes stop_codon:yes gene_type:complete
MDGIYEKLISITNLICSIKADHMQIYDELETINKKLKYRERNMVEVEDIFDLIEQFEQFDIENSDSSEDSGD